MAKTPEHLVHETAYRGEDALYRRGKAPIVLAGVGALGSHLAPLLVRQGYLLLTLVDRERIDRTNFGTQNFGQREVGRMKATTMRSMIVLNLGVSIQALDEKVTASNVSRIIKGAALVVDLFDNPESRNLLRDACAASKINCLHAGMSQDGFAEIQWNEGYRAHPNPPAGNQPCEYPLAANLVAFTVAMVAEAINAFVDRGEKRSFHFTLRDLHVDEV